MVELPDKLRRAAKRQLGSQKLQYAVVGVALGLTLLHMVGSHIALRGAGREGLAAGQLGLARQPYDIIVGLTHHKTGTSQMGCLLYHFAYALNLTNPVYQDNFVLHGNIAMHMARTTLDKTPLTFLTGHELMKQCYYQNATKHWVVCPNQFPCKDGRPILGLANCFLSLPVANLALLHFVRNPVDVVVSAYRYHMQDPPPEKWIEAMKVPNYVPFLEKRGVPLHRLDALGMSRKAPEALSYGELLRSLPPERGVHLEFWRTLPMMYGMAQQFLMLERHPSALQVRFEDLRFHFNATVRTVAEGLYAPYSADTLLAAAHAAKCDPGTWDAARRAQDSHVTWGKGGKEQVAALRAALLRDKSIRRHLCGLQGVLGYAQEEECGEARAAAAWQRTL